MDSFFLILLAAVGYFIVLSMVLVRSNCRRGITTIAAVVLLIYGCLAGMLAAIGMYAGGMGLFLYSVAIVYSIIFWIWKGYHAMTKHPRFQVGELLTMCAYMMAVLYITIFMREGGSNFTVQMEVMNWMQENGVEDFKHIVLNVAMFVPIGVLFPFVTQGRQGKTLSAVSFGLLFSVLIETGQLLMHSGTCDIDDLITNFMGTFIGAAAVEIVRNKMPRYKERVR